MLSLQHRVRTLGLTALLFALAAPFAHAMERITSHHLEDGVAEAIEPELLTVSALAGSNKL